MGNFTLGSGSVNIDNDSLIRHAINEIYNTYGHTVSVNDKAKSLLKFGENASVGTSEATVMELAGSELAETYATGNTVDRLVVSDTFTGDVTIEGLTTDGSGNLTFVTQTLAATSTSAVTLTTPLFRPTRAFNASGTNLPASSKVYIYDNTANVGGLSNGVPQTASSVKLIISAAENQSLKASTSLSNNDYALITEIYASVNKKTQGGAVIRFKVRNKGGVFRTLFKRGVNSLGPDLNFQLNPFLIIPPNSDIIITAEADTGSTPISAGFNSYLAIKI